MKYIISACYFLIISTLCNSLLKANSQEFGTPMIIIKSNQMKDINIKNLYPNFLIHTVGYIVNSIDTNNTQNKNYKKSISRFKCVELSKIVASNDVRIQRESIVFSQTALNAEQIIQILNSCNSNVETSYVNIISQLTSPPYNLNARGNRFFPNIIYLFNEDENHIHLYIIRLSVNIYLQGYTVFYTKWYRGKNNYSPLPEISPKIEHEEHVPIQSN